MKIIIILVCMVFLSFFSFADSYADEIDDLIPFIIKCESNGNPNAVSNRGAIGLMQITPIVLKEFNDWRQEYWKKNGLEVGIYQKDILFISSQNKIIGTWYLRRLKNYYLKDVKVFDHPYRFNRICFNTSNTAYTFKHTKYIKCAKDYKLALILSAYNGGITRLRKYNYDISKMPKETRNYVKKVMRLYNGN